MQEGILRELLANLWALSPDSNGALGRFRNALQDEISNGFPNLYMLASHAPDWQGPQQQPTTNAPPPPAAAVVGNGRWCAYDYLLGTLDVVETGKTRVRGSAFGDAGTRAYNLDDASNAAEVGAGASDTVLQDSSGFVKCVCVDVMGRINGRSVFFKRVAIKGLPVAESRHVIADPRTYV